MSNKGYFPAISGLRAIAVLSILVFHVDPEWLPGGFIGVDIFFVISGFVVTHSVMGAEQAGFRQFIATFYKRRFQRILPAAYSYIVIAAALSMLFIPLTASTKFIELTGSAAAVAASNIILWLKTGDYFSESSELNPFTHTWSLAIEEQFYLLFPAFAYPLVRSHGISARWRAASMACLVAACMISVAAAALLSSRNATFAFYMLPTRFWELATGVLLRTALDRPAGERLVAWIRQNASLASTAGLLGLGTAFAVTRPDGFPYPGALLPCAATALLILVLWSTRGGWLDTALAQRLPVAVGNISYSLYLWHWGVIVLMRWTIGLNTLPLKLTALALSILLGWVSYAFVEKRFHNPLQRRKLPTRKLFAGFALAAAAATAVPLAALASKPAVGLAAANDGEVWDPYRRPALPADCPTEKHVETMGAGQVFTFPSTCTRARAPALFILGDSHAGAYQRAAWRIAATGRYRVTLMTMGGCRPILLAVLPDIPGCSAFLQEAEARIRATTARGDVIFLPGLQTTRYRSREGQRVADRPLDATAMALSRARLEKLAGIGPVVIVEDAKPLSAIPLNRCVDWFNRANPECAGDPEASPLGVRARVRHASEGIAQVAGKVPGVTIWHPADVLCDNRGCPSFSMGKPLFFDTDHLSAYANDLLYPSLLRAVDLAANRGLQ